MKASSQYESRPAVPVVPGIGDALKVERRREAVPYVDRVVRLDDLLASIREPPITEEEPPPSQGEILPMVISQPVAREGDAGR